MQPGARRHGIAGTPGILGTLESVTYRIYRVMSGFEFTISANKSLFFNYLY